MSCLSQNKEQEIDQISDEIEDIKIKRTEVDQEIQEINRKVNILLAIR